MTNQEAIASLRTLCHNCKLFPKCAYEKPECFKAIEMAISALEAQELKQELKQEVKNLNESSSTHKALDTVSRQAVAYLDLFTKTYCRDYSVTDDLVFRCKECEFEASGGKCLVKCMARMLCPDYKEFGCMGDL